MLVTVVRYGGGADAGVFFVGDAAPITRVNIEKVLKLRGMFRCAAIPDRHV
jgi:hypothetical protein